MIVAYSFCNEDVSLAARTLQWSLDLQGQVSNECLLVFPKGTQASGVAEIAGRHFSKVETFQFAPGGRFDWPYPQNRAFHQTAWQIAKRAADSWLWWEPDAIPLKAGWLTAIEAEYAAVKKAFVGALVPSIGHINGVAVYPHDISNFSNDVFLIENAPFDVVLHASPGVQRNRHASKLFLRYCNPDRSTLTFTGPDSLKFINPECVLFHGCKDGSLIDVLRRMKSLPESKPITVESSQAVSTTKTFYHSGDYGDIIYSLLAIKMLGGGKLSLGPEMRVREDCRRTRAKMTQQHAAVISPLLVAQPYISSVEYAATMPKVDYDLNEFRPFYFSQLGQELMRQRDGLKFPSLCRAYTSMFGISKVDENASWLSVKPVSIAGRPVVVNRTARYHNNKFDWQSILRQYLSHLIFVGTEEEHKAFESEIGAIAYHETKTLLDLAQVIAGAELFIGNQSCSHAIAEGLKQRLILEARPDNDDCFFDRPTASHVLHTMPELPLFGKPITISMYLDSFTGLGKLSCGIARELVRRGYRPEITSTRAEAPHVSFPDDLKSLVTASPSREPQFTVACPFEKTLGKGGVVLTMWESSRVHPEWITRLNAQRIILVPSIWGRDCLLASGLTVATKIVPMFVEDFEFTESPSGSETVFGCGGRTAHGNRKCIDQYIEAFKIAFKPKDKVRLIVKLWPDCPDFDTKNDKRIQIIKANYDHAQMQSLYSGVHCWLATGLGEGWNLMAHEAMACGRPVIGHRFGGQSAFLNQETAVMLKFTEIPATGDYAGMGSFASVPTYSLMKQMRAVRDDHEKAELIGFKALQFVRRFSVQNTVDKILEAVG